MDGGECTEIGMSGKAGDLARIADVPWKDFFLW